MGLFTRSETVRVAAGENKAVVHWTTTGEPNIELRVSKPFFTGRDTRDVWNTAKLDVELAIDIYNALGEAIARAQTLGESNGLAAEKARVKADAIRLGLLPKEA